MLFRSIKFDADRAKIVLEFENEGIFGSISRTFSAPIVSGKRSECKTSAALNYGSGDKAVRVSGVAAVNAKIVELTGISNKVLSEHIFIAQEELSKLLFSSRGDVLASFMMLIPALADAESKRALLQKELVSFPELVFVDTSAELQTSKQDILKDIATTTTRLSAVNTELASINKESLLAQLVAIESNRSTVARLETDIALARNSLAMTLNDKTQRLNDETVLQEKLTRQVPQHYALPEMYAKAKDALLKKQVEQSGLHVCIDSGRRGDKICPSCGLESIDISPERLDELQAKADQTAKDIAALSAYIAGQNSKEAQRNVEIARFNAEQEDAKLQLSSLRTYIDTLDKSIATYNATITSKTAELAKLPVSSPEAVTAINTKLDKAGEFELEQAKLTTALSLYNSTLKSIEDQLAAIDSVRTKSSKLASYRKLIDDVRNVLHKENLQKDLLTHYLVTLCSKVNEYLKVFNSPFSVDISTELDISARFPNGYVAGISRLSGGQKCALSIAFRFAINDIFAKQFGMIVLDEPTAYLDDDNLSAVGDLISRVHAYTEKTGMEVIIITHDKEILPNFSNVIDIARENSAV